MTPEQEDFLEALHKEYFNRLALYAESGLFNRSKAQDVVQDTFHDAVKRVDELIRHTNPPGWLTQTVKNKVREYNRSHLRYTRRFLSLDSDLAADCPCLTTGSSDREDSGDNPEALLAEIRRRLTPEELYLMERFAFDKASHLEIAQELGITVWSSQKRLQRAREKLSDLFPQGRGGNKK